MAARVGIVAGKAADLLAACMLSGHCGAVGSAELCGAPLLNARAREMGAATVACRCHDMLNHTA
jgi:hypothetical protein